MWTFPTLESIAADARYAMRWLAKERGFAIAAILAIALGVGASTAVFALSTRSCSGPSPIPASRTHGGLLFTTKPEFQLTTGLPHTPTSPTGAMQESSTRLELCSLRANVKGPRGTERLRRNACWSAGMLRLMGAKPLIAGG